MQEIEDFFACIVGVAELLNSNMLPEFSREPKKLRWQPNLVKISQNCTDFSSVQEIEDFFASVVKLLGSANSNVLSEISRSQLGSCYGNQI